MRRCISIFTTSILLGALIFMFSACSSGRTKVKFTLSNDKSITVTIYGKNYAPETAAHFLQLVKDGYFDNVVISGAHSGRIIAGDFTADAHYKNLTKKPSVETVRGEFEAAGVTVQNNPIVHELGTLSLMNIWAENELGFTDKEGGKNTGSNIFFFTTERNSSFDGKYTAFGKITDKKSLEVLTELVEAEKLEQSKQDEILAGIDSVYDLSLYAEPIWIVSAKII